MSKQTLYIDESGTHAFTDTREPKSKHFFITGLSVNEKEDNKLSGYFEYLKRSYSIDSGTPFHSYDIFENRKSSRYLTPSKARALTASLAEFIKIAPIQFSVFYLNKHNCRQHFGIKNSLKNSDYVSHPKGCGVIARDIPYEILAANTFWWFVEKMVPNGEKGAIIAESRDHSDHSLLDVFLNYKNPDCFRPLDKKHAGYRACDVHLQSKAVQMREKITSLKFENKIGECPGLELADLISYITFQNIEGRMGNAVLKNKGLSYLWKVVKQKMENSSPTLITGEEFSTSIRRTTVNKISKFNNFLDTL